MTTQFVYDGAEVIIDLDDSGTELKRYTYGPGIDEVLAIKKSSTRYYLTRDGLNSTTDVTDSAGTVVESYKYDVYGAVSIFDSSGNSIATSAVGNRYLYTGREWEPESGLYYYRARHYDPTIGRFLQPDPIGYADGLNLYQYVGSDPVNFVDPFGLLGWKSVTGTILALTSAALALTSVPISVPIALGIAAGAFIISDIIDQRDYRDDIGTKIEEGPFQPYKQIGETDGANLDEKLDDLLLQKGRNKKDNKEDGDGPGDNNLHDVFIMSDSGGGRALARGFQPFRSPAFHRIAPSIPTINPSLPSIGWSPTLPLN